MQKYNEYSDYNNDDEDEDSAGTGFDNDVETDEDIGQLSFGMEKSEAKNLIENLFIMPEEIRGFLDITKQIWKNPSYSQLTKANIEEILEYAINKKLIKPFYEDYIRTY